MRRRPWCQALRRNRFHLATDGGHNWLRCMLTTARSRLYANGEPWGAGVNVRLRTYLSRTMYLRHRVQTQAVCQPSYRFHSANFLIVMRNVFGLLHTVHARGCHCKGCFLNDWVELRNVACQVPMMSQLSLSPRIFGV